MSAHRGAEADTVTVLAQARFQLSCSLCAQAYGACIQCAGSRQCFAAFHPTCAAREGLRMVRLGGHWRLISTAEKVPGFQGWICALNRHWKDRCF
jgi:hypothetical protein